MNCCDYLMIVKGVYEPAQAEGESRDEAAPQDHDDCGLKSGTT